MRLDHRPPSGGGSASAYVLHLNGLLPEDAVLDSTALPKIVMPNRDGFTSNPRPDVPSTGR